MVERGHSIVMASNMLSQHCSSVEMTLIVTVPFTCCNGSGRHNPVLRLQQFWLSQIIWDACDPWSSNVDAKQSPLIFLLSKVLKEFPVPIFFNFNFNFVSDILRTSYTSNNHEISKPVDSRTESEKLWKMMVCKILEDSALLNSGKQTGCNFMIYRQKVLLQEPIHALLISETHCDSFQLSGSGETHSTSKLPGDLCDLLSDLVQWGEELDFRDYSPATKFMFYIGFGFTHSIKLKIVFIHCFMDLVAKGHTQDARSFFQSFREDHEALHLRDLQKLESVLSPQHLEEMEFARSLRQNKVNIKMCQVQTSRLIILHLLLTY
eukprot:Gb_03023 [translate_table: standard]